MCGLAGIVAFNQVDRAASIEAVGRMCRAMRRRGPDADGLWTDPEGSCVLGHRRLSILDPTPRANQPMVSGNGRYVCVFNGEIYNFRELRRSLAERGVPLRSTGDTEVLLESYSRRGPDILPSLRGMFSLAIWDRLERTLFLARDPYGIKPLYVADVNGTWLFASQVKAILRSKLVSREPSQVGQASYWLLGSVLEPHTWYRDVTAFPAGCWGRIDSDGSLSGPHVYEDISSRWRLTSEDQPVSVERCQGRIQEAVTESVRRHVVADVPVGVFLSGGIDSGTVAAHMRDHDQSKIHGITIAFSEFRGTPADEAPLAAEIAEYYGVEHHVRIVTREEFERDVQKIFEAMDQPSIDGVNTWYASKAAKELGLKVVLTGVGGDELFFGYRAFQQIPRLLKGSQLLLRVPGIRGLANLAGRFLANQTGNPKWRWLSREAVDLYGAYWLRRGLFTPEELPLLMGDVTSPPITWDAMSPGGMLRTAVEEVPLDPRVALGLLHSVLYLRNQLLRDSDWASMYHGVELRTPLVDAHLLESVAPVLPQLQSGAGKLMLARSPQRPLPTSVVRRQKSGFGIPIERWIQTCDNGLSGQSAGLRDWARLVGRRIYEPTAQK